MEKIRKRARPFPRLVLALALAVWGVGCGGDGDDSTDRGSPTASTVSVQGDVRFADGTPVAGAEVSGVLLSGDAAALRRRALRGAAAAKHWSLPAAKSSPPLVGRRLAPALESLPRQSAVTGGDGGFALELEVEELPARLLVEVTFQAPSAPVVRSARWARAEAGVVDLGTIVIPDPEGAELQLSGGSGQSADGSIRVDGMPPEIARLFARSYDPDASPEAFPGEFAEMGEIPLNSTIFLWMEALDAAGNAVTDLSRAATVRARVPPTQWTDLEDIDSGTDRIEIPIYFYDEAEDVWVQEGVGWLENGDGTILPEDAQSVILDGSFPSDIFAAFATDHLSWMNVDYPYIGPWTLSRLDPGRRNNDCLFEAATLAQTIALSDAGRAAFATYNKPGADLGEELADGAGPEFRTANLGVEFPHLAGPGLYGGFHRLETDQFYLDEKFWDRCENAREEEKRNVIFFLAMTALHETAHWKWHVIHEDGNLGNEEPDGEAGWKLISDLFGDIIVPEDIADVGSPPHVINGPPIGSLRDELMDPAHWPPPGGGGSTPAPRAPAQEQAVSPLEMTLSLPESAFQLGEQITVTVSYRNVADQPIRVMEPAVLEGYPLWFRIVRDGTATRVPFLGPRVTIFPDSSQDFATLQPGQTLETTVHLIRDAETGRPLYNPTRSGTYQITGFYSGLWGLPETASNTVALTLQPGGSISGTVTDSATGAPVAGAMVRALQNGDELAAATSDSNGDYTVPELPAGVYTLEARAPGFLRSREENVSIVAEENSVIDFSLSSFLAQGELRLVLSWDDQPEDLDAHLWLPVETPYHVHYQREGELDACPFAHLDTDDTDGRGPETITITQRNEGTYLYAVHNFSEAPDLTVSQARVQVFDATGLIATFNVPTQGSGDFWHVLSIDGATGSITEINELGGNPEPYPDTDLGCAATAP